MKELAIELAEKNEEISKLHELIELMKGEMARVHDSCSLMSHQEVWIRNVLKFAYNGKKYVSDGTYYGRDGNHGAAVFVGKAEKGFNVSGSSKELPQEGFLKCSRGVSIDGGALPPEGSCTSE
jgi:hypothetical protein